MEFLGNHKLLTNAFVARDRNILYPCWYGEAAYSRTEVIRASSRSVEQFIDWADKYQFTILNTPGTFTHFPSSDYQPTIPDLTFARGDTYNTCQSWSSEELGSGD